MGRGVKTQTTNSHSQLGPDKTSENGPKAIFAAVILWILVFIKICINIFIHLNCSQCTKNDSALMLSVWYSQFWFSTGNSKWLSVN